MFKFEKISKERYLLDMQFEDSLLMEEEYNDIKLPTRATEGSCGYDFYMPYNIRLKSGEAKVVKTGIRWVTTKPLVLKIYVRSSIGINYGVGLSNGTAIIDSDYSLSPNEGHIMIKLVNNGSTTMDLYSGDRFAQGIIQGYYVNEDKPLSAKRCGGIGSSGK